MLRSTARSLRIRLSQLQEFRDWKRRDYSAPSPNPVKREVLRRYSLPDATWIETGTYAGDTTAFLAPHSKKIFSVEPEPKLFALARERFRTASNVEIINDVSEVALPAVLAQISGNVCLWLDGHFSAGDTFQGSTDCPIEQELMAVAANMHRFSIVNIMIDDIRLFGHPQFPDYPTLDYLVNWCREHSFKWSIEQDILIAQSTLP